MCLVEQEYVPLERVYKQPANEITESKHFESKAKFRG